MLGDYQIELLLGGYKTDRLFPSTRNIYQSIRWDGLVPFRTCRFSHTCSSVSFFFFRPNTKKELRFPSFMVKELLLVAHSSTFGGQVKIQQPKYTSNVWFIVLRSSVLDQGQWSRRGMPLLFSILFEGTIRTTTKRPNFRTWNLLWSRSSFWL